MNTLDLLKKYNIPFELWGRGSSKTLAHLEQEVKEGETILEEENGNLYRLTSVMHVRVFYNDGHKQHVLREDRQVFNDGRTRRRPELKGSISEKLKPGETASMSVILRALEEELGIKYILSVNFLDSYEEVIDSPSYPGLFARFTNHFAEAYIAPRDFKPEGYVEIQKDKTTFFVWDVK